MGMGRRGRRFQEEGIEGRYPGFLFEKHLVLCCESEEDLSAMGGCVAGAIRSQETLLVPFLMYSSDAMMWNKKERSRFRSVQMYALRRLLGIRRMDKVPNSRIKELYVVTKVVNEKINECVLR